MKKTKKQLGLSRETISALQPDALGLVVGGNSKACTYPCATWACNDSLIPSCRPQ